MTPAILIEIGIYTAIVIVVAAVAAMLIVSVGDDFPKQFQDEQDDERSQRRRC
ncbi:hypothetical protein R77560_04561 [Ralstonia thomasii]|uniref:Transmembrane protein n=1 Tax=Ralstonia thomasii TaxID=3058596 RepID=A0AAD2BUB8_9RALS|nr:hypothetical protein [Ralstonia sp. LMG 18095]CAJ0807333.1 hypothetical protein R77560_04561 [Ralstonia sp. LMG 18095]CAJ0900562.1 hypothetical protein R6138_04471 [Ralstonia sp. LMG 18095]